MQVCVFLCLNPRDGCKVDVLGGCRTWDNNNPIQMMEKTHFLARCKVLDGLGVMLVVAIGMKTEPKKVEWHNGQ